MDYTEIYQKLFNFLKSHEYKKFADTLNKIDITDIMFDINVRDTQENYFLTYAVSLNRLDIVLLLIEKGAKIDIVDKYDRSILLIPIMYSYDNILKTLLDENKNQIGISVIDIKDKNYKVPLHYAIETQNINAINMLLEYGANPNIIDKDGYNSLHIAIKSRSSEICNIIIKYVTDIDSRYNTGETALHLACNLQLIDMVNILLKNNINVNITDHSHEITALHYSVLLNNKDLVALLLKYDANPNIQDIYGNTALHYCVMENNFEIFMMLTQHESTKNIINFNMWNIDGETPLHLILKQNLSNLNDSNVTDYLDIILDKSNLTIQDNMGNTCLYYLIKLNLWSDYRSFLVNKKLDIFSINNVNISPLDIVDTKYRNDFIDIVIDSYITRLKNANELWYYEWENICSKNFNNISDDNFKIINEKLSTRKDLPYDTVTSETFEPICKEFIKRKILELHDKIHNGENINCFDKSFPMRRSHVCVNIAEGSKMDYCTFTGSTLDILIGLIFLLTKHKNTCGTLTKNFAKNTELCGFYKSIGILMNSRCEFLNFEIVWVHQKLYLIDNFYDLFKQCLQKTRRFIIIPLGIEMREVSHAGYLIYDKLKNEIERFEPHGSTTPVGLHYNPNLLDEILESRFKSIDENMKYIRPKDYLPKIGFQLMDVSENNKKRIGDPNGFCALWCIWYVDMRLTYSDIDRKELVYLLIKTIRSKNISFRNMIRNYATNIIDSRDNLLKKSKMDINDWLNDEYNDTQIDSIMDGLMTVIKTVM